MQVNHTQSILLPDNLRGRNLHTNIIPTVSNLKNMLQKLSELNGDAERLKSWDKRSYNAYHMEDIKNIVLKAPYEEKNRVIKNHILSINPKELGASCLDIYLVAYVAETFGSDKQTFFNYVKESGISDKENSAQAIWQVGKGDGMYLEVLNEDGTIADWNFFARWIKGTKTRINLILEIDGSYGRVIGSLK